MLFPEYGLGSKAIAKAGGTVVLLPGGEIFTSLSAMSLTPPNG